MPEHPCIPGPGSELPLVHNSHEFQRSREIQARPLCAPKQDKKPVLALLLKGLVGSKLPGLGVLGVRCVTEAELLLPVHASREGKGGGSPWALLHLLAGGSMDRWFGSFLETSDPPVLPPVPGVPSMSLCPATHTGGAPGA